MASAAFGINGGVVGIKAKITPGGAIVATLASTVGVRSVQWIVANVDDNTATGDYTLVPSGALGETVTLSGGNPGTAGELQVTINNGKDLSTDQFDLKTTRYTVKWFVPVNGDAGEVFVSGEQENANRLSSLTHGIIAGINDLVRKSAGGIDYKASARLVTDGALPLYNRNAAAQVWQVDDSLAAFVEMTSTFNSGTTADVVPFPASEDIEDYFAIGMATKFTSITIDGTGGTNGVGGVVAWEYWTGTIWSPLSAVVDGTTGFTNVTGGEVVVSYTVPTDWAVRSLNGSSDLYYIRARVTTVYSTNPVFDVGYIGIVTTTLTAAANGAFPSVDGVAPQLSQRMLLNTAGTLIDIDNGIFFLQQLGDGSNPWILERVPDSDETGEITPQMVIRVEEGTAGQSSQWVVTNTGDITVGETAITLAETVSSGTSVDGPGASTDHAIARWDGVAGTDIQNSGVLIDDSNNITGVLSLGATTVNATTVNATTLAATTTVAIGASPASVGAIRLSNNEGIYSDSDPTGTDIHMMSVNASELLLIGQVTTSNTTVRALNDFQVLAPDLGFRVLTNSVLSYRSLLTFALTVSNPQLRQEPDTTAATGQNFTFNAQDLTGSPSGARVGGLFSLRGSDVIGGSTNTGGGILIRSGTGATANGEVLIQKGSSVNVIGTNSSDHILLGDLMSLIPAGGGVNILTNNVSWGSTLTPVLGHTVNNAPGFTGNLFSIFAQGVGATSGAAKIGGPLLVHGGDAAGASTDNTGGAATFRAGNAQDATVTNVGGPVEIASGIGTGTGAADGEVDIKRGTRNVISTDSAFNTVTGHSVTAGSTIFDAFSSHIFRGPSAISWMTISASGLSVFNVSNFAFDATTAINPIFSQGDDSFATGAPIVGDIFTIHAQNVTRAEAFANTGGNLVLEGGDASNGSTNTGGNVIINPGTGATTDGSFIVNSAAGSPIINYNGAINVLQIGAHQQMLVPQISWAATQVAGPNLTHQDVGAAGNGWAMSFTPQGVSNSDTTAVAGALNLNGGVSTATGDNSIGGAVNAIAGAASGGTVTNVGGGVTIATGIGTGTGAADGELLIKRGAANIVETNSSNQTFFGDTVGNESYWDSSGIHYFRTSGSVVLMQLDSAFGFNMINAGPNFAFGSGALNPLFYQGPDATTVGNVVGDTMTIEAQIVQGAAAFDHTGGGLVLRGGAALGAGSLVNIGGSVTIVGGAATVGATSNTGGAINIQPGVGATANGNILLKTAAGAAALSVDGGSGRVFTGAVAFQWGGSSIEWTAAVVSPFIQHQAASAGSGTDLRISAQNSTFSTGSGGNLLLRAGDIDTGTGGQAGHTTVRGGESTSVSGASHGGDLNLFGGSSEGGGISDTGGDVHIRPGVADSDGDVFIEDATGAARITVDGGTGVVTIPTLVVNPTDITLTDNVADAFLVREGTNDYIDIDTTDGSETMTFGFPGGTNAPSFTFITDSTHAQAFRVRDSGANNFINCDSSGNKLTLGSSLFTTTVTTPNASAAAFVVADASAASLFNWNTSTNLLLVQNSGGNGATTFQGSGTITFNGALLTWGISVAAPKLTQVLQSSGDGDDMTIEAQSCSGSSSVAGSLIFKAGSHSAGTNNSGGDVQILPGTEGGTGIKGSISLITNAASYQAMEGGIFIANRTTAPTGNPASGGYLFVESGALKYRGSSGAVTELAPA